MSNVLLQPMSCKTALALDKKPLFVFKNNKGEWQYQFKRPHGTAVVYAADENEAFDICQRKNKLNVVTS